MKCLVWFRNDLRLYDNAVLNYAFEQYKEVYCIYCFDEREFKITELGFPKTNTFRANFLIQSVENLRLNLKKIGGNLIVRKGDPKEILPELARNLKVNAILASQEVTSEETSVEKAIQKKLSKHSVELKLFWQSTLYHLDDLPFEFNQLPDTFTNFRKSVEKKANIKEELSKIEVFNTSNIHVNPGEIPSLKELGLNEIKEDKRSVLSFTGGEDAALERLNHYLWETESLSTYKYTRNGLIGPDYSSKFSPWLALGCISPRKIYWEVQQYELEIKKNSSTYWLVFELIWRDYFRFVAHKFGNKIFKTSGIKNKTLEFHDDEKSYEKWKSGTTGVDFIDANMIELNATGFMSNRGRQNVASYLTKDLKVNWTWGASYFESQLIDYDPCSNWGNWCYVAGVGNDPREDRYFNIKTQAERYDPKGEYVSLWLD